jgi:hypothetical protein
MKRGERIGSSLMKILLEKGRAPTVREALPSINDVYVIRLMAAWVTSLKVVRTFEFAW